MILYVQESAVSTNAQEFLTPNRVVQMVYVRPHIYKHLAPAGSVYFQLQSEDGKKIADSDALTAAQISSANYFHGFVRFTLKHSLAPDTYYRLAMKTTGYTFSESAYFGWCNGWDLGVYPEGVTRLSDTLAPLNFEIWERKHSERRSQ